MTRPPYSKDYRRVNRALSGNSQRLLAIVHDAAKRQFECLSRWSKGLKQGRDDYVGVEDNPDHEPGCNRDSRLALRAAAISVSISSLDN
jgi:hypothetical protein